nr:hypothetical protein [Tessaracoccus sp.]
MKYSIFAANFASSTSAYASKRLRTSASRSASQPGNTNSPALS